MGNSGIGSWGWGFDEGGGFQGEGLERIGVDGVGPCDGEAGAGGGVGEQGLGVGEGVLDIVAEQKVLRPAQGAEFVESGQAQSTEGPGAGLVEMGCGQVEFMVLGVDEKVGAAAEAGGVGLLREAIRSGDAQEADAACEAPALGDGDGNADASVTAGAEADGKAVHAVAWQAGGIESSVDQRKGAGVACVVFGGFAEHDG